MKKLMIPAILLLALQIQSCQSNSSTTTATQATDDTTAYVDTTHNSENSLDWAGTYKGTIPCADCPGINTTISLNEDGTFKYDAEYLDRKSTVQDSGTFMWHGNGSIIHLVGKDLNTKYKVGENVLIQLDSEGNEIEGPVAKEYYIHKVN